MVDELLRVLTAASGLISLAIGLYVFLKGRRRLVNILFFMVATFMTLWALGEAMTMAAGDLSGKIFWTKFQGIGELMLVPTYLMLALYFPEPKDFMRKRSRAGVIIATLYAPWILGLVLLYTTNVIYSSYFLIDGGQGIEVVRTQFFWFLTVLGFSFIIAAILIFLTERRKSRLDVAHKGLFILAVAPVPMLIANFIQNFGLNQYITTPQASFIFASLLAYGIMRYGLFVDMRSVAKNLLVHTVVILADVALYSFLCSFYIYALDLSFGLPAYILFALTGIPFMLAYHYEVNWARRLVNRSIYGREMEEGRLLRELGMSIRTVRGLNDLAKSVVDKVRYSLNLAACALMLKEDGVYRVIGFSYRAGHTANELDKLVSTGSFLRKAEEIYSVEDREGVYSGYWEFGGDISRSGYTFSRVHFGIMRVHRGGEVKEMIWREDDEGEVLSVPLEVGGEEIGLMWLGGGRKNVRFSVEELDYIAALSTQVSISLRNAQLMQEILDKSRRLQSLVQSATTAQEEERIRISRELHDGLAPYFLDIIFKLEMLEGELKGYPSDLLASVNELREKVRSGLRDLRILIADLRPSSLDVLGLQKSLYTYLERFGAENNLQIEFRTWGNLDILDSLTEVTVFRVAQEALSNIARHACARHVRFRLGCDDGHVEMSIEDDGISFVEREVRARIRTGECLGIKGMEERAELVQGDLSIIANPGNGTRINFTIPVSSS